MLLESSARPAVTPDVRPRIGLVVPPANTAVEDDYAALGTDTFTFSTNRYAVHAGLPLRERLDRYAAELPDRVAGFGSMPLHAVMTCCSGNHYLQGFDTDLAACVTASRRAGHLVVSTTVAVVATLRLRGIDTVTIASPYAPWLTELSEAYWHSAGFSVDSVLPIRTRSGEVAASPYDITTADIVAGVRGAGSSSAPVLFVGTGMHTRDAVAALTADGETRPLLSSNSCGVDWLRRTRHDADPLGGVA